MTARASRFVGPVGQPGGDHSGFAIAKDRDRVAARSAAGGIWVTRHAAEARWQESIPGTELTDPSWHRDGTLWTFDRHNGQVLRSHPAVSRGPEHVAAPALQGMDVTSLRMARDGVRVAVRIGTRQVQVGALNGGGAGAMLSNFHLLTMAERDDKIIDIAWGTVTTCWCSSRPRRARWSRRSTSATARPPSSRPPASS